jgi:hypothetical protein
MFHPIRTYRNTLEAIQLTILNFQKLLLGLISALDRNTTATAELLATAQATLTGAELTQSATAYLASAERHSREQAGQRTEFVR